jgi:hypothetical protein
MEGTCEQNEDRRISREILYYQPRRQRSLACPMKRLGGK